ncbi:MAG: SRPBCC family protein [Methylobacillus glycogenes]|nr:SRPBCC family protein [Methylobacillus glycogenes]
MKTGLPILLAMLTTFALPLNTVAQGKTSLQVSKTITINADAQKVWALAGDFGGMQNWHPAIASTQLESRPAANGRTETVRVLTLKDGGTITENLISLDQNKMRIQYAIITSVLPISDYSSTITVKKLAQGKTEVHWQGHFNRAYQGKGPIPPDQDDDTARKVITQVYESGLASLKQKLETP